MASGSSVRPVCTCEGSIIVEDGAATQPNRSEVAQVAERATGGVALNHGQHGVEVGTNGGGVEPGSEGGEARLVQRDPGQPRYLRWEQCTTTPTFMRSPRSTRGTTRRIVYWNAATPRARSASSTNPAPGTVEAAAEKSADVRAPRLRALPEPVRGNPAPPRDPRPPARPRREPLVGLGHRSRVGQEHMLGDQRERRIGPVGRSGAPPCCR